MKQFVFVLCVIFAQRVNGVPVVERPSDQGAAWASLTAQRSLWSAAALTPLSQRI